MRARGGLWMAAVLALAACGGSGEAPAGNEAAAAPEPLPSEEQLAREAELANEAAADEAADMDNFGGSAAEMDMRNAR